MSAQVFNLGYDNFLGRLAIGRMYAGNIHVGDGVIVGIGVSVGVGMTLLL